MSHVWVRNRNELIDKYVAEGDMILLTDEECFDAVSVRPMGEDEDWQLAKAVARTQLKKVAEWGREACLEHLSPMGGLPIQRHGCEICWQSLREEE